MFYFQLTKNGCQKKHGDCSSLFTSSTVAFKKGENILVGAASKFEDDVVIFQNIKYGEQSRSGSICFTLKRIACGSYYYVRTIEY